MPGVGYTWYVYVFYGDGDGDGDVDAGVGLGDDPPRDRTAELRVLGFPTRHLGPVQMTTDTALGVTKRVVEDRGPCLLLLCVPNHGKQNTEGFAL